MRKKTFMCKGEPTTQIKESSYQVPCQSLRISHGQWLLLERLFMTNKNEKEKGEKKEPQKYLYWDEKQLHQIC